MGLRGEWPVAESVLTTLASTTKLRLTADRIASERERRRSFVRHRGSGGCEGRPDLHAEQDVQFSIAGPGVIAAVGNGDGQDPESYHAQTPQALPGASARGDSHIRGAWDHQSDGENIYSERRLYIACHAIDAGDSDIAVGDQILERR